MDLKAIQKIMDIKNGIKNNLYYKIIQLEKDKNVVIDEINSLREKYEKRYNFIKVYELKRVEIYKTTLIKNINIKKVELIDLENKLKILNKELIDIKIEIDKYDKLYQKYKEEEYKKILRKEANLIDELNTLTYARKKLNI